jgi:DNA-directed RNA polymerase specialized sigma24 family protein
MHRRAARQWAKVHEFREDLPDFAVLPEADRLGSQDEIRRCVADLTPEQAEALLLHHEWGFRFEEIAGMLGISAAAARARASRGMADLRAALNSLQTPQAARRALHGTNNSAHFISPRESIVRKLLKKARA